MEPGIFELYNRELQLLRELGGEFARANPAVAARLQLDERVCPDPYVERLIESVAFLAARTQLKLEARHPQFTQQLLAAVNPAALSPIPSAMILEFNPKPGEDALKRGVVVPVGTTLRSEPDKGNPTPCEFRTTQAATLWPLTLLESRYIPGTASLTAAGVEPRTDWSSVLELRFTTFAGVTLAELGLDALDLYVAAAADTAARLCDQLHAECRAAVVQVTRTGGGALVLPASAVSLLGFDDAEALLPPVRGSVDSYRLLREYFAFPQKFRFLRIAGLAAALKGASAREFTVTLVFSREDRQLSRSVQAKDFRLHCVPTVNLFNRRSDRVEVSPTDTAFEVVVDRFRRQHFEVYGVDRVVAIDVGGKRLDEVRPLYAAGHGIVDGASVPYYTIERRQRLPSSASGADAPLESVRTDTFISMLDARGRRAEQPICQLEIDAVCTNGDLPQRLAVGSSQRPLSLTTSMPVHSLRVLVGPTPSHASHAVGDAAWRAISLLSVNFLTLAPEDPTMGARLLRELLSLYVSPDDAPGQSQLKGIRSLSAAPVVRRVAASGAITYCRGLELTVEVEEAAFAGVGALTFGAVLERFFARYSTINSFTETCLVSSTRGLLRRWPARVGRMRLL